MTTDLATMTRADMECAVLEYDILPAGTAAECAAISALTDDALREAIGVWIEAGNECAV
jgi:hypothetical protein